MDEESAFQALLETYVANELGQLSDKQAERLENMEGAIEHIQAQIAKSLIASTIGRKIDKNPEINMEDMSRLVVETINDNLVYGVCDVFKE